MSNPAANGHSGQAEGALAHPIVWTDVTATHDLWWASRFGVMAVGCALTAIVIHLFGARMAPASANHASDFTFTLLVMAGIGMAFAVVVWASWRLASRDARRVLENQAARALDRDVRALLMETGGIVRWPLWRRLRPAEAIRFQEQLGALGHPSALTIVAERFRERLESLEPLTEFVEPEPIVSRPRRRSGCIIASGLTLIGYVLFVGTTAVIAFQPGVILVVVVVTATLGLPVARAYGLRIGEDWAPIAGMGVVSDRHGRRWTVADSCLYLHKPGAQAEFVGPEGYLRITFWDADDAALHTLRRWTHSHPRPELG